MKDLHHPLSQREYKLSSRLFLCITDMLLVDMLLVFPWAYSPFYQVDVLLNFPQRRNDTRDNSLGNNQMWREVTLPNWGDWLGFPGLGWWKRVKTWQEGMVLGARTRGLIKKNPWKGAELASRDTILYHSEHCLSPSLHSTEPNTTVTCSRVLVFLSIGVTSLSNIRQERIPSVPWEGPILTLSMF